MESFVFINNQRQSSCQTPAAAGRKIGVNSLRLIWRFGAGVLIGVLIFASLAASNSRRIEVTSKRFAFEPAEITIQKGEAVDLVLKSDDVQHGVRIRELNIDLRVAKGKPAEVKFTADKVGTFVGHCSVFCGSGHGKMTLTIHVVA